MTDLAEQWVNIYKSKKHGSYWTGAFCYKTKEEAVKDLADKENYLTTVNIEDMLQKSENVAKNVANENSQDLTEQWKQKKLPLGWYFVKNEDGKIDYAEYMEWFNADGWCGNYFECEEKIVEVLAEAPDYIDWRNMVNCACEEHEANNRFIEENKRLKHDVGNLGYKIKNQRHEIDNRLKEIEKLKEVLKECKMPLEVYNEMFGNKAELLTKIDEVLK